MDHPERDDPMDTEGPPQPPSTAFTPGSYIRPGAPFAEPGPYDVDLPPPLDDLGRPLPPSENPLNPFANMQLISLADRGASSVNRSNISRIRERQSRTAFTDEEAKAWEGVMLKTMGITDPETGEFRVASLTSEKDVELLAKQKGGVFVRRDASRGGNKCLYPDASAAQLPGGVNKRTKICLNKEDIAFDTHGVLPFKLDILSQCDQKFLHEIERVLISFPVIDIPVYTSSLLLIIDGMHHDAVTSVMTALKTYMLALKMISMDERVGKNRKEKSFKRIILLFQEGRLSRDEFAAFLSSAVPKHGSENYWTATDTLLRYDNTTLSEDDMKFAKGYIKYIDSAIYDIDLIEAGEGVVSHQAEVVGGIPQPSGYSDDYMREFEMAKESLTHGCYGGGGGGGGGTSVSISLQRILTYGFDLLTLYEATLLRLLEQIIPKERSGDFTTKREIPPANSIHQSVLAEIQKNKDWLAKARAPESAQSQWEPIPQNFDPPYVSEKEYLLFLEFIDSNFVYLPIDVCSGQDSSTDRGVGSLSASDGETTTNNNNTNGF